MPIRLEIGINLGVYDKYTGGAVAHPGAQRLQVIERPHPCRPGAVAARNGREIRIRKLDDVDAIAAPPVEMHFGRIGAVVINQRYTF